MLRPITGTLLATGLLFSASVKADPPESFTNPPLPIGVGGDSVTGGGEWAIVTDQSDCSVQIFRLDYATMEWNFFQTVTSILANTCANGEFGLTSSIAGNVLVVGVPGWDGCSFFCLIPGPAGDNRGGLAVFTFDGTTWSRLGGLNDPQSLGNIERAPDFQSGARYGSSVSISQVDNDNYTIMVGSPLHDGAGANNAGKVYAYNYNSPANDLTFIDDEIGNAGFTFGFAVTVNPPYFLVGAPGVGPGGINNSPGGAYVYRLIGSTLTLNDILTEPGTDSLGREVSLSADFALVSSDADALVWENTGTPASRSYAGTPANIIAGANGGDVSQSSGVAFFGRIPPGQAGATGVRDPVNDPLSLSFDVPVAVDYAGDNVDEAGRDIRLARESLFFANAAEDRALLYQFPAGFGGFAETPFTYYQRSLPCDVTGLTLADVFGPGSFGSSPAGTYDVFLYDATAPVTSGRPFKQLDDSYVFTAADADYSLWIATDTSRYTPIETCNDFTDPDLVNTLEDGGTPFVDTVRTQSFIELPLPAFDNKTGETFARIMVNMPYPRDVLLSDVRYVDGGGGIKTLVDADAADEVFSTVYVYDPTATIPSGQNYRAITASGTPPFNDRIRGFEGFWVRVEENAVDNGVASHALLMPQPE